MSDGDKQPTQQNMTLHGACEPSLKGGTYLVEVQHWVPPQAQVKVPAEAGKPPQYEGKPTFEKSVKFKVSTPQFSLAPSEIYEFYPPDGARGVFHDTLPHVVLARRTLPWERSPGVITDGIPRSWMALLLFHQDELGTKNEQDGTYKPKYTLNPLPVSSLPDAQRSNENATCVTLKVPVQLFRTFAPSWADLPYVAHVREVGNTAHMDSAGIDDKGWFSVVVCNRLPRPGENHLFLVSLEGLKDYLPDSTTTQGEVTLVVLANWRFVAVDPKDPDGKRFSDLLKGLNCGPLRLPPKPAAAGNGSVALSQYHSDDPIESKLQFGYVPLLHQTREGLRTVSWYRGPLVPHFLPNFPEQNRMYFSADAALRYDNAQGLFDISYAAAWQLGRLLGLQSQPFAQAVSRMTLGLVQEAALALVRQTQRTRFGDVAENWQKLAVDIFAGAKPEADSAVVDQSADYYTDLKAQLEHAGRDLEIPLEIKKWLAQLFLLNGVPFDYLLPHSALLPEESLRLFYVDSSWVAALMDGALSIGRTAQSQLYLDKAMAGDFLKDIAQQELKNPTLDLEITAPKDAGLVGHITGFLLRSKLVTTWRGVEIQAQNSNKEPLGVLRMQRIAKDVLLAIYNGHIRQLVITQPPQGLHFGPPRSVTPGSRVPFQQLAGSTKPAKFAAETLLQKRVRRTISLHVQGVKPEA